MQTTTGFLTSRAGRAADRMDLLTAVMHEMGHLLGLPHEVDDDDLMAMSLRPGERPLEVAYLATVDETFARDV